MPVSNNVYSSPLGPRNTNLGSRASEGEATTPTTMGPQRSPQQQQLALSVGMAPNCHHECLPGLRLLWPCLP